MVECASLKTRNVFMDQALYHQQYCALHAECQARLHANANSLVGFSKKRAPVVHAMKNHQPHAHFLATQRVLSNLYIYYKSARKI